MHEQTKVHRRRNHLHDIARRAFHWLIGSASIGSIVVIALAGCSEGGGGQQTIVPVNQSDIDTSYGKQGQTIFPLGVQNGGVGPSILQADGKLIIAGWRQTELLPANCCGGHAPSQLYVLRLNGDGSPDASFGVGGEVRFNVKGSDTVANVQLQPDGKILLAVDAIEPCLTNALGLFSPCLTAAGALASSVSALVRLTPQGSLDPTLGGTGIVESTATTSGLALAVQADGKILFLRSTSISRARIYGWSLARYNADGTPDSTFNQGNPISSQCQSDGNSLAVQADGRIVVGGTDGAWYAEPTANPGLCLERINTDGSHDSNFRTAGFWTSFDANVQFNSLSALPNGGLLAAGRYCDSTTCGVAAARYDVDGLLDASFGVSGLVKLAIDNTFRLTDYSLTPAGELVLLGTQTPSASTGQVQQYQPVWIGLDVYGNPASGFGATGINSGTPDTKLPQDFLQDQEGRWLIISRSIMSDGNLGMVVTRLVGNCTTTYCGR